MTLCRQIEDAFINNDEIILIKKTNVRSTAEAGITYDQTASVVKCNIDYEIDDGQLAIGFTIPSSQVPDGITQADVVLYDDALWVIDYISVVDGMYHIDCSVNTSSNQNSFDSDVITWDSTTITF